MFGFRVGQTIGKKQECENHPVSKKSRGIGKGQEGMSWYANEEKPV